MLIYKCSLLQPVNFPAAASITRYRIQYKKQEDSYFRYRYVYPPRREYTLTRLQFGATYNISIRVELRFSYCYSYLYGEYSDYINATTRESGTCSYMARIMDSHKCLEKVLQQRFYMALILHKTYTLATRETPLLCATNESTEYGPSHKFGHSESI